MQVTPQQVARWYNETADKREASFYMDSVANYGYRLTYAQAAAQADVPEPWRELIVAILMAGYWEFHDWAQRQLKTEKA